jgi:hypothetical protein
LQNLKKRLSLFFPEMTAKEYRFLMNNKKELTIEDFNELLMDNDLESFDPTVDAFRAVDPTVNTIHNSTIVLRNFEIIVVLVCRAKE